MCDSLLLETCLDKLESLLNYWRSAACRVATCCWTLHVKNINTAKQLFKLYYLRLLSNLKGRRAIAETCWYILKITRRVYNKKTVRNNNIYYFAKVLVISVAKDLMKKSRKRVWMSNEELYCTIYVRVGRLLSDMFDILLAETWHCPFQLHHIPLSLWRPRGREKRRKTVD